MTIEVIETSGKGMKRPIAVSKVPFSNHVINISFWFDPYLIDYIKNSENIYNLNW